LWGSQSWLQPAFSRLLLATQGRFERRLQAEFPAPPDLASARPARTEEGVAKFEKPLASARSSEWRLHVCSNLPSRDRKGAELWVVRPRPRLEPQIRPAEPGGSAAGRGPAPQLVFQPSPVWPWRATERNEDVATRRRCSRKSADSSHVVSVSRDSVAWTTSSTERLGRRILQLPLKSAPQGAQR
jgi:hypothetical protein